MVITVSYFFVDVDDICTKTRTITLNSQYTQETVETMEDLSRALTYCSNGELTCAVVSYQSLDGSDLYECVYFPTCDDAYVGYIALDLNYPEETYPVLSWDRDYFLYCTAIED